MKTYHVTADEKEKCSTVIDALVLSGLVVSRASARQLVVSGGCYINDVRVESVERELSTDDFLHGKYILLRKGKKNYCMLKFNPVVL